MGISISAACGPSFTPDSYVTGLRVLGVRAEPPEAPPGESSVVTALVVDTDGAAPVVAWATCRQPRAPGSSAVPDACVTSETAPFLEPVGTGESVTVRMPDVPPTEVVNQFGLPDYTGGFYLPVRLRATAPGGASPLVTAVYRLRYGFGFGVAPNHNPGIAGVFVVEGDAQEALDEAAPRAVAAGSKVTLRATFTDGSAEDYQVFRGDPRTTKPESRTELPNLHWFATAGDFSQGTTGAERPDTELDLSTRPPTGTDAVDVWVVAQDERGGSDFVHRRLVVR